MSHPLQRPDDSFAALMSTQIERAPWVGLSLSLHAILLLVLWLLPIHREVADPPIELSMLTPEPPIEIVEPPPAPTDPIVPEDVVDDPVLAETPIESPTETDPVTESDQRAITEAAFTSLMNNATIGLGGSAGGPKYAGRPRGPRGSGSRRRDPTVDRALDWLVRHQDEDGRWDSDEFMKHDVDGDPCDGPGNPTHDVGVTGLATLAFLGDGNSLRAGEHREVVRRAVVWLRDQQDPETGLIGVPSSNEFVYDHTIATLALVEACGLSKSRVLRPTVERALAYLAYHRSPYTGWRYQPRDGDCDTSVTGWAVLALEAADDFGFAVDRSALAAADEWLERVTDPATGRTGYLERGGRSSRRAGSHAAAFPREAGECMTSVSLLCRVFRGGIERGDPLVAKQAELVAAKGPRWDTASGAIDHYAWYYATYALYQIGGAPWREWRRGLAQAVVPNQRKEGNAAGSWDPVGVWGDEGGRVYSTAVLCLTMQAGYRYARVLVR